MVRTHEFGNVAQMLLAELHAPMRAPILDHADSSILVANNYDRFLSDERALEVPGVGQFRFERHVIPAGTAEDSLLLPRVDFGIRVNPVRNPG